MKTEYRFIRFEKDSEQWLCYNIKSCIELSKIEYYPQWRQYVIIFNEDICFNDQCLKDIADFLGQLNKGKKGTKAKPL